MEENYAIIALKFSAREEEIVRIKFVVDILVKEPKPGTGKRTVELEFEKELKEERTINGIMDSIRDVLEKDWGYKEKDLHVKKISMIE